MRLPDEPDIPAQINMSTLFLTRQEGLPVNLPKASTSQQSQVAKKITVTVDADGEISVNKKPTTVDVIAEEVRGLVGTNPEAVVIINADEAVGHGKVVAVMDQVRQVKGARLAIATQK
jgi:biopolymer transport protein ExbD